MPIVDGKKFAYTAKGKAAAAKAAQSKSRANKPSMYPPPKNKKSLLNKMKAVAKKIPGTETNKRAKRNKGVVTGVGRKPTYRDKD
jgi:hypothetical protein